MIARLLPAAALTLAACGGDALAPSTLLTEPRLLAVAAEPPVTTLDGEAALSALVVDGDGAAIDAPLRFRACSPWQLLRDPDLDCGPDASLPLTIDGDGVARLRVADVIARFGGPGAPLPPPGDCPGPVVAIPVVVEATVDGTRLVARKDLAVGSAARRAPTIAAVTLDDAPAERFTPGAVHRVAAIPAVDSLDATCTDDPDPVAVLESVRTYFYVSAGGLAEVSADVTYQPDGTASIGSVEFTAPDDDTPVRLWSVMLDGDGGAAWTLRTLTAR